MAYDSEAIMDKENYGLFQVVDDNISSWSGGIAREYRYTHGSEICDKCWMITKLVIVQGATDMDWIKCPHG